MGMTDLVLDTDLTAEQREFMSMVKMSADSLLGLLNDILDFSKIEAGKLELDPIPFDFRDFLDDTMKILAHRATSKGLELACQVNADVPDRVVGDAGRLRQIVVNLVGNAIKFTEHGEVVVSVGVESRTDASVMRAYSPFATPALASPTTSSSSSSRLFPRPTRPRRASTAAPGWAWRFLSTWPLSWVAAPGSRARSGRGARSTSPRPWAAERSGPGARPPPRCVLKGLPVLVVDDNATNRRILQELLTNWGMAAGRRENGRDALRPCRMPRRPGSPTLWFCSTT